MLLRTLFFGTFLIDNGKVVDKILFPNNMDEIIKRYRRITAGGIVEEEEQLASTQEKVEAEEKRLLRLGNAVMRTGEGGNEGIVLRPEDSGFSPDILREITQRIYSEKLEKKLQEREILELSVTLDHLNRVINLLEERRNEWGKTLISGEPAVFTAMIGQINGLEEYRERLTTEIESKMREECPNLSTLLGEILGARLIALAGGKRELARLPSSTVQILGAENAFFRFRKTGVGMPKHGLIFQHPFIKGTPKPLRGKAARALAAGIVMAARVDYFSGRNIGDEIRERTEGRIKDIRRSSA